MGTNRLAHLLESPGACKRDAAGWKQGKAADGWGLGVLLEAFRKVNSCILAHSGMPPESGASLTDCVWAGFLRVGRKLQRIF